VGGPLWLASAAHLPTAVCLILDDGWFGVAGIGHGFGTDKKTRQLVVQAWLDSEISRDDGPCVGGATAINSNRIQQLPSCCWTELPDHGHALGSGLVNSATDYLGVNPGGIHGTAHANPCCCLTPIGS